MVSVRRCGGELAGEPVVDLADHQRLTEADVQRVLDAVGQRVLGGEAAAVVRKSVDPVASHPPAAQPAPDAAPAVNEIDPGRVGFGGRLAVRGFPQGLRAVNNAAEGTALAEFACC
jgi:hypothetical protein